MKLDIDVLDIVKNTGRYIPCITGEDEMHFVDNKNYTIEYDSKIFDLLHTRLQDDMLSPEESVTVMAYLHEQGKLDDKLLVIYKLNAIIRKEFKCLHVLDNSFVLNDSEYVIKLVDDETITNEYVLHGFIEDDKFIFEVFKDNSNDNYIPEIVYKAILSVVNILKKYYIN